MITSVALKALAARAGWTAFQALVGVLAVWVSTVDVTDQPGWAAAILLVVATGLSAIKSFIASKVGDPETVTFK